MFFPLLNDTKMKMIDLLVAEIIGGRTPPPSPQQSHVCGEVRGQGRLILYQVGNTCFQNISTPSASCDVDIVVDSSSIDTLNVIYR